MKTQMIIKRAALLLTLSGLAAVNVQAQSTNTWITVGDGVWDDTAPNWTAGAWTDSQVGTPIRAKFIDMQMPVAIQVDSAGVQFQALEITGTYTFNGDPLKWTSSHGETGFTNTVLTIGASSSVTFNTALNYSGTNMNNYHQFNIGAGSVVSFNNGSYFKKADGGDQQWRIEALGATVNLNGAFTGLSQLRANGTINHQAAKIDLGNNELQLNDATYNVNHADAYLRAAELKVANGAGNASNLRRTELNISSGTVNVPWHLAISNASYTDAVVNVSGGWLKVDGNNGANGIHILQSGGGASNQTGLLAISGGAVTTSFIDFGGNGAGSGANTNSTATLKLTGGALYLGNGVTSKEVFFLGGGMDAAKAMIELGGGTIGSASNVGISTSMNMTLTGSGRNLTFFTSNTANQARDLTLSGVLSGTGGLEKTGNGTLLLSGANTYAGDTIVSAGTLQLNNVDALGGVADLSIFTGALVDLNYTGTAVIDSLLLNGVTISNLVIGQSYNYNDLNTALGATIFSGDGLLSISTIPEPSTWALLLTGAALLALLRRPLKNKKAVADSDRLFYER